MALIELDEDVEIKLGPRMVGPLRTEYEDVNLMNRQLNMAADQMEKTARDMLAAARRYRAAGEQLLSLFK